MKPGLQIGHQFEYTLRVREDMQAQFEQTVVHPLYATASMITHMEWAARQHILPYLEAGEEGVGYHVDVKHLRPTPIGAMVRIRSTVSAIEERKITSLVEAWNETEKIGEGTLVQALVPLDKLYATPPKKIMTAPGSASTPAAAIASPPGSTAPQTLSRHDRSDSVENLPQPFAQSTITSSRLANVILTQEEPPSLKSKAAASPVTPGSPVAPASDNPPPATLVSTDNRHRFALEILKWESGGLACTRYDEWLVCRVDFSMPAHDEKHQKTGNNSFEGAFLLRYEIEEWQHALEAMLQGQRTEYFSDFLESVLQVHMENPSAMDTSGASFEASKRAETSGIPGVFEASGVSGTPTPDAYTIRLSLTRPAQGKMFFPSVNAGFSVSRPALQSFARQLEEQLEGFPSRL